jgi:hypothetical protein
LIRFLIFKHGQKAPHFFGQYDLGWWEMWRFARQPAWYSRHIRSPEHWV